MPIPDLVAEELERAADRLEEARAIARRRREEEKRAGNERRERIARAGRTHAQNAALTLAWVEEELRPVAQAVKKLKLDVLWTLLSEDSGGLILEYRDGQVLARKRIGFYKSRDEPVEDAADLARRFSRTALASLADQIESGEIWREFLEAVRREVAQEVELAEEE